MKHPKLKEVSYYGFSHDKVALQFEGDLSFCAEFCVNNEYHPIALYRAKSPNKEKGHKEFMLLNGPPHNCVRGMTRKELSKWLIQDALLCSECNVIIYSINRHHYNTCGCSNESFIDGGRDYTRYGAKDMTKIKIVKLNHLTKKIKDDRKKLKK